MLKWKDKEREHFYVQMAWHNKVIMEGRAGKVVQSECVKRKRNDNSGI